MPEIVFKGKERIHAHHLTVPLRPLVPNESYSLDPEGKRDNLIIHGDNLDALKALMPWYEGKVKCIYIDPPYNTGNEKWVYNDRVNSRLMQEWFNKVVDKEDLEKHDKWLCMMWPRLHLMRRLLSDDGVIFISVDDNEHHHLKMLMNDIFGESNFIESFIWRSRQGKGATSKNTASLHEYIVTYAKRLQDAELETEKRFKAKETTERLRQWGQGDRREDRPTMFYPVQSTEFREVYPIKEDGTDGRWRVGKKKMKGLLDEGLVIFEEQPDGRIEASKIIAQGTETETAYSSMLDPEKVKTTAHGTTELGKIIGPNDFPYPKPSLLIKELISLCTSDEDIILDSFAGSGTTAQSVLALNKEDGNNRKFILVECEEYAKTIITERVRKVIEGVPSANDKDLKEGLGGHFSFCTLGEAIDIEDLLRGINLPSYQTLATHLLYTAAQIQQGSEPLDALNEDGLFFETEVEDYYLLYKPDRDWLRSNNAMLDAERARRIGKRNEKTGRKAIVFGPGRFMGLSTTKSFGITFSQLPYDMQLGG